MGRTYFWRVDENAHGRRKVPGPVWSFTVRPVLAKTDPSLVGWWKMDDEKSGVAVDYSGYDNYGTLIGGPTFVEGYLGDALSFDGVDDYRQVRQRRQPDQAWTPSRWPPGSG